MAADFPILAFGTHPDTASAIAELRAALISILTLVPGFLLGSQRVTCCIICKGASTPCLSSQTEFSARKYTSSRGWTRLYSFFDTIP